MRRPGRLLATNRGFDARLSRVVHTKINAVVLFCFIDKKIFKNVLPICWSERFFADRACKLRRRNTRWGKTERWRSASRPAMRAYDGSRLVFPR